MSDESIEEQCEVVYDYEKLIGYRKLAEDHETFDYILSLPNHKVKMHGARRWFTIHSGSFIHPVPHTYIYFVGWYYHGRGQRCIEVAFVNWMRGIFATGLIDYYTYPYSTPYVASQRRWVFPHSKFGKFRKMKWISEDTFDNAFQLVN